MIKAMTESTLAAKKDRLQAVNIMQEAMTSALHQGTAAQLDMYQATNAIRKARSDHKRKSKP
jgi:nucleoid DNA-binding protein